MAGRRNDIANKEAIILKTPIKLKPCPFCGGLVKIILCDRLGNIRPEEYEADPYSGLGFLLDHNIDDNPECPIAHEKDYDVHLGFCIYDTRDEAAMAWNRRKG